MLFPVVFEQSASSSTGACSEKTLPMRRYPSWSSIPVMNLTRLVTAFIASKTATSRFSESNHFPAACRTAACSATYCASLEVAGSSVSGIACRGPITRRFSSRCQPFAQELPDLPAGCRTVLQERKQDACHVLVLAALEGRHLLGRDARVHKEDRKLASGVRVGDRPPDLLQGRERDLAAIVLIRIGRLAHNHTAAGAITASQGQVDVANALQPKMRLVLGIDRLPASLAVLKLQVSGLGGQDQLVNECNMTLMLRNLAAGDLLHEPETVLKVGRLSLL